MPKPSVLLVDDESRVIRTLKILLRTQFEIFTATRGREALEILQKRVIHVLVSDQRMPEMSGVQLLARVKEISPNTMRIMLTGYSDTDAIVASINQGEVFRFINKPWRNQEMKETVNKAAEIAQNLFSGGGKAQNRSQLGETASTGILVLDDRLGISLFLKDSLKNRHRVYLAKSLEEAMKTLSKEDVGVLLADIRQNNSQNSALIKILKREYPLLVSVVITDEADADTAIGLINQGQVFRYLTDVKPNQLLDAVGRAAHYFQHCKKNPEQVQRHQVEQMSGKEEVSIRTILRTNLNLIRKRMLVLSK